MTSYCFKILVLTVVIVITVVVLFNICLFIIYLRVFTSLILKKSSRPGYLIYILLVFLCSDRQALGVPVESKL